jgi:nitrate reductase NapE component
VIKCTRAEESHRGTPPTVAGAAGASVPEEKKIGWIETLMMYLGVFPLQTTTMVGIIGISVSATVCDITYTLSRCTTHFEHVGNFVTE